MDKMFNFFKSSESLIPMKMSNFAVKFVMTEYGAKCVTNFNSSYSGLKSCISQPLFELTEVKAPLYFPATLVIYSSPSSGKEPLS